MSESVAVTLSAGHAPAAASRIHDRQFNQSRGTDHELLP